MYQHTPTKRYQKTLRILDEHLPAPAKILDLGVPNPLSGLMKDMGYEVDNTGGEDLDYDTNAVQAEGYDAVTGFEILEHMVNPMPLLQAVKAPKLILTVPLRLWFTPAYRSDTDKWDRHYHEFEDWQFDWLLEKAGWEIIHREKWTSPAKIPLGVRPLLRSFTPRYYGVVAERP
jgi:hypothetical protein